MLENWIFHFHKHKNFVKIIPTNSLFHLNLELFHLNFRLLIEKPETRTQTEHLINLHSQQILGFLCQNMFWKLLTDIEYHSELLTEDKTIIQNKTA